MDVDQLKPMEQSQQIEDDLIEQAIFYCQNGKYPEGLSKDKKRAVRKKAQYISVERGEVFLLRKNKRVSQQI